MTTNPVRPLHTTGRLATRMSEEERAELMAHLKPFMPTAEYLAHPPSPLEVELGIGNGLAMLARAHANPHGHYLGCEVYLNGLRTLLNNVQKPEYQPTHHTLRLTNRDGRDLLEKIKPGSIHRLGVFFPDPWPKTKHHKRRLIQPEFLTLAAKAMAKGGELWVVTDWPDYALHTVATLYTHPNFVLAQSDEVAPRCKTRPKPAAEEAEEDEAPLTHPELRLLGPHHLGTPPEWWVPTKYQQKAESLGRKPWFIKAVRK